MTVASNAYNAALWLCSVAGRRSSNCCEVVGRHRIASSVCQQPVFSVVRRPVRRRIHLRLRHQDSGWHRYTEASVSCDSLHSVPPARLARVAENWIRFLIRECRRGRATRNLSARLGLIEAAGRRASGVGGWVYVTSGCTCAVFCRQSDWLIHHKLSLIHISEPTRPY